MFDVNIKYLKSILITRCEGSLGDAVISSFIIRELKKQFPAIKIGLVCFGACYDYYIKNKYVDKIYKLPVRNKIRPHQRWPELIWSALKIRMEKFDLVVDSSDKDSLNWSVFKWICSKKNGLYDRKHNSGTFGDYNKHRFEHEKLIFDKIGLICQNTDYDIYSTPEAENRLIEWLNDKNIQNYICLNAFGAIKQRTFNKSTVELIINSIPTDKKYIIPAMPDKAKLAISLIPDCFKEKCMVFETNNVFEFISLISHSSLVISPDTAAIHIASGCKKPVLGFYNNYTAYYSLNNELGQIVKTDRNDVNVFDKEDFQKAISQLPKI